MSLTIVLDQSNIGFYPFASCRYSWRRDTPGSTISGYVALAADKEQSTSNISILFTGRCEVKISKEHREGYNNALIQSEVDQGDPVVITNQTREYTYRSRGYYFAYYTNLSDNVVYQPGAYRLPFIFRVPTYAEHVSVETAQKLKLDADFFQEQQPWIGSGGPPGTHMIPDTMVYSNHGWGDTDVDEANIEYKLTARLVHGKGSYHMFSGDKEEEVDVMIKVPPALTNVQPQELSQDCTVKSLRLLPSHASGHLFLREKTHSLFHKSDLPTVAFRVVVSIPGAIPIPSSVGEQLKTTVPFLVALHRTSMQSVNAAGASEILGQDIPTPKVTLKKLRLHLNMTTSVRDNGAFLDGVVAAPVETLDILDESLKNVPGKEHTEIPTSGQWLDLGSALAISLLSAKETLRSKIVSSFATYNIYRRYALEFKIELNCADEEIKFECEDEQAIVVSLVRDFGLSHQSNANIPPIYGHQSHRAFPAAKPPPTQSQISLPVYSAQTVQGSPLQGQQQEYFPQPQYPQLVPGQLQFSMPTYGPQSGLGHPYQGQQQGYYPQPGYPQPPGSYGTQQTGPYGLPPNSQPYNSFGGPQQSGPQLQGNMYLPYVSAANGRDIDIDES